MLDRARGDARAVPPAPRPPHDRVETGLWNPALPAVAPLGQCVKPPQSRRHQAGRGRRPGSCAPVGAGSPAPAGAPRVVRQGRQGQGFSRDPRRAGGTGTFPGSCHSRAASGSVAAASPTRSCARTTSWIWCGCAVDEIEARAGRGWTYVPNMHRKHSSNGRWSRIHGRNSVGVHRQVQTILQSDSSPSASDTSRSRNHGGALAETQRGVHPREGPGLAAVVAALHGPGAIAPANRR